MKASFYDEFSRLLARRSSSVVKIKRRERKHCQYRNDGYRLSSLHANVCKRDDLTGTGIITIY